MFNGNIMVNDAPFRVWQGKSSSFKVWQGGATNHAVYGNRLGFASYLQVDKNISE